MMTSVVDHHLHQLYKAGCPDNSDILRERILHYARQEKVVQADVPNNVGTQQPIGHEIDTWYRIGRSGVTVLQDEITSLQTQILADSIQFHPGISMPATRPSVVIEKLHALAQAGIRSVQKAFHSSLHPAVGMASVLSLAGVFLWSISPPPPNQFVTALASQPSLEIEVPLLASIPLFDGSLGFTNGHNGKSLSYDFGRLLAQAKAGNNNSATMLVASRFSHVAVNEPNLTLSVANLTKLLTQTENTSHQNKQLQQLIIQSLSNNQRSLIGYWSESLKIAMMTNKNSELKWLLNHIIDINLALEQVLSISQITALKPFLKVNNIEEQNTRSQRAKSIIIRLELWLG